MTEPFDIDKQIDAINEDIAKYTKLLFEAQGMMRLALHIKDNCDLLPKYKGEEKRASSRPAR